MSRHVTPEEVQRGEAVFGPLTQSLRELIDVAIRSDADADDAAGHTR